MGSSQRTYGDLIISAIIKPDVNSADGFSGHDLSNALILQITIARELFQPLLS